MTRALREAIIELPRLLAEHDFTYYMSSRRLSQKGPGNFTAHTQHVIKGTHGEGLDGVALPLLDTAPGAEQLILETDRLYTQYIRTYHTSSESNLYRYRWHGELKFCRDSGWEIELRQGGSHTRRGPKSMGVIRKKWPSTLEWLAELELQAPLEETSDA